MPSAESKAAMRTKFRIATAVAKKQGFKSFKAGSAGDRARRRIAEGIAKKIRAGERVFNFRRRGAR